MVGVDETVGVGDTVGLGLLDGLAGAVFAAVTSLGEIAITALISGANTVTVPVRIFSAVQFQLDPSVAAVSTLLMAASVIVLLVLDRFAGVSDVVA